MVLTRNDVPTQDRWDTVSFYPSWEGWEADFIAVSEACKQAELFRGRLAEGPQVLSACLMAYFETRRAIDRVTTYAHLRQDENLADDRSKNFYQRATALGHRFSEQTAWLVPELLSLSEDQLRGYGEHSQLADYRFFLQRLVRERAHTLSEREEELLSMAAKALHASSSAFGMLENADFRFGVVTDGDGKVHDLTLSSYQLYQRSTDRELRRRSFEQLHRKFEAYENTICELLNGEIQSHVFQARARHFSSCVEAALFPHNIDVAVYRNLIAAVRQNLGSLHRYVRLRRQVLGLGEMHAYDLMAPLIDQTDRVIAFDEAVQLVTDAVLPLGERYSQTLKAGLGEQRWVDRYENQGKRSGAYSSGCYDSHPYILMNYTGGVRDALVLAHEAGHSMHSSFSHAAQLYHNAQYPIFLAEVASTFNEELLFRLLLERATTSTERMSLISQRIDDIRATLFRQTLFAEFELWLHELAERGEPLTPSLLKERYRTLNADYYGEELVIDDRLAIEWARVPHFYYNFYVYQYATGISAALYLVDQVAAEGEKARDGYLDFLSAGGSGYPLDLLGRAGVQMHSTDPIVAAIRRFDQLVMQLEVELGTRR